MEVTRMLGKKAYSGPWGELSGWILILIVVVIVLAIIIAGSRLMDLSFLSRIGG